MSPTLIATDVPVVPDNKIDPTRRWVGLGAIVMGGLLMFLAVILQMFPVIGGLAQPGLEHGATMIVLGFATIWDRTVPIPKL